MEQPNGHPCPECGAPRNRDNTPACGCTRRASEALRDARTAEAAAAEDFDPLRIRPYVELDDHPAPTTPDGSPASPHTPPAPAEGRHTPPPSDATPAPAPGVSSSPADPTAHGRPQSPEPMEPPAPDATMTLKAIRPDTTPPGTTPGPGPAGPGARDAGVPGTRAAGTDASDAGAHGADARGTEAHGTGASSTGVHGTGASGAGASHAGARGTEVHSVGAHGAGAHGAERQAGGGGQAPVPAEGAVDATMTLRAVQPGAAAGAAGTGSATAAVSGLPTPLAPGTARPNADDLGLFDDATRPLRHVPAGTAAAASLHTDGEPPRRNRMRRGALIAASGAVVAVLGAAGWASGLFSYDSPSRDDAAPDDVRASVPDQPSGSPSAEPSPGASSASPSASPSASDSPSAGASASASPSPSASSSAPSASAPAEPSATASTGAASSAPAAAPEPSDPGGTAPVLRRGDRGPEVTELQQRLRQVWLYHGDIHGQYTPRVEEAVRAYQWSRGIAEERGVYGPQTRARLEAETQG